MDNNDPELVALEKKFDELPDEVAGTLIDPETARAVDTLSDTYGVSEKKDAVLKEVGNVLLGLTSLMSFTTQLSMALGLTQPKTQTLADAIVKAVFDPIRSELLSISPTSKARTLPQSPPNTHTPAPQVQTESTPRDSIPLSEQIAQFQARKKAREEEARTKMQQNAPRQVAPPTNLPNETPASQTKPPQAHTPEPPTYKNADPYREPLA